MLNRISIFNKNFLFENLIFTIEESSIYQDLFMKNEYEHLLR